MDFLLLIKKIILGIIQGIAEILPISSSGHLVISENILGISSEGMSLIVLLHFGSLVAMCVYYWKDIWNIILGLIRFLFKKDRSEETMYYCHLFINLIIASVPAAIIGFTLGDIIDAYLTNLYFVFLFLTLTGILLLFTKKFKGEKSLKELKPIEALAIGCFQGVGVLPGVSRSGSTIFGGRTMRLSNEAAAHFSFLMFLPVTAGSFLVDLIKDGKEIFTQSMSILLGDAIAVIVAGFVTYFSVKYLFHMIKKGKLFYFAFYCFIVAIIGTIVCLATGYGF